MSDEFEIYDLAVEVVHNYPAKPLVCKHQLGDVFYVKGSVVEIPPGKTFGLYAMLAVLQFVPAKQRPTQDNDWMSTDSVIGCTDPNCGAGFKITRLYAKRYRHADHSAEPLPQ